MGMSDVAGSSSVTQRINTGWGKVYVTIAEDDDGAPIEVFVNVGRSGGLFHSQAEALGKTISTGLAVADDPEAAAAVMASRLIGIRTDRVADDNGDQIYSIPDAIGIALKRRNEDRFAEAVRGDADDPDGVTLP